MKQTNNDVKKKGLALVKYFLQTPPYMQCLCNSFFLHMLTFVVCKERRKEESSSFNAILKMKKQKGKVMEF